MLATGRVPRRELRDDPGLARRGCRYCGGDRVGCRRSRVLCRRFAHLGHLHHTLTQQQLNEIGRVDVVIVPVDGSYTLDLDGMIEVLTSLKAPLMIPMHYFSSYTLDRFISRVGERWDVERSVASSVVLSKFNLPEKPKLLVLPGRSF